LDKVPLAETVILAVQALFAAAMAIVKFIKYIDKLNPA